jgi:hypothetical protein
MPRPINCQRSKQSAAQALKIMANNAAHGTTVEFLLKVIGRLSLMVIIIGVVFQMMGFSKVSFIDAMLEKGSTPEHHEQEVSIDRLDEVKLIKEYFIMEEDVNMFGVVLGPSGTGKTYLTRLACRLYPSGVIYHEIVDPSTLPTYLAKAIGMRLREDANIVDVLLEKLSVSSYVHFYTLPQDLSSALSYVLETLAERAVLHKEKHGRNVCLFIDGVDLLAKEYPLVFLDLVDRAKYYANEGTLRIVLVSSEGHVMPLLANTELAKHR